jgi:hypothetical protein
MKVGVPKDLFLAGGLLYKATYSLLYTIFLLAVIDLTTGREYSIALPLHFDYRIL